MRKYRNIVVANWKMNPETLNEAKKIFNATRLTAKSLKNTDIVICPPFPFLFSLSKLNQPKNIFWGVQDVATEIRGTFTGEVSANMSKNLGAKFVIIGHSERRAMGETNEIVRKKLNTSFNSGLTPILCIGEKERDKEGNHLAFIKNQVRECLINLPKKYLIDITIAYEPIWSIGKSYREAMNPTDVHVMVLYIKKVLSEFSSRDIADSARVLYGGSVESENALDISKIGNVDGFLVGHASLIPEQFSEILKSADLRK